MSHTLPYLNESGQATFSASDTSVLSTYHCLASPAINTLNSHPTTTQQHTIQTPFLDILYSKYVHKQHEFNTFHPRHPPRPLGPNLTHLHLPFNRPSNTRRIRPRRRLSRLQIPHLVLVRRLHPIKARQLSPSHKTISHNARRAMSPKTRREFRGRCGAG